MPKKDKDRIYEKDAVEAAEDLPGVPEGTAGKVTMITGLTWIRYRVRFENGQHIGQIDASQLRKVG